MKVLFVDNSCEGHHKQYICALVSSTNFESVLIIPERISELDKKQYVNKINIEKKNPVGYWKFIRFIKKVANTERVDVIHFLSIDPMVKYFGVFLNTLKSKYKIVVTFHHFRYSRLHSIARQMIFSRCYCGVVHTRSLKAVAESENIKNCVHIEYPNFKPATKVNKKTARNYFGINNDDVPVLGAVGGTRLNKGLDILLLALKEVKVPFYLLIAGKEETFGRDFIEENSRTYADKLRLNLKYLTDEEMEIALVASDVIVLPYRKSFDGASGPLGEGVALKKMVVGAAHGSLGDLIRTNHLGFTFQSENVNDLAKVLNEALTSDWKVDNKYIAYQKMLSPQKFCQSYSELYLK